MSLFLKTAARFAAAGLIAGHVAAMDLSRAHAQSTRDNGVTGQISGKDIEGLQHLANTVYNYSLQIGRYLETMQNPHDRSRLPRLRIELKDAVQALQRSLLDYRAARPDLYLPDLGVDGRLGRETSALLLEVAALESFKEIFIDRPEVQMPDNAVAFRFLRNELKRLAPDAYINALSDIAGEGERKLQTEKMKGFLTCVDKDERRFSQSYIDRETLRISENPGYISPAFQTCAGYLGWFRKDVAQQVQIRLLNGSLMERSRKGTSGDWCAVDAPNPNGSGRICLEYNH